MANINERINQKGKAPKSKWKFTDEEFHQKIKTLEKKLALEEAHSKVMDDFDESRKNIKIDRSFNELHHIREYNKGNEREYHRNKLEEHWYTLKIAEDVIKWQIAEKELKELKSKRPKYISKELKAEMKSDNKKFLLIIAAVLIVTFIILYLGK